MKTNLNIQFGKIHEDFARTALIMISAKSVVSADVYGYYYYQSESSITRGNNQEKIKKAAFDLLDHYDYMIEYINSRFKGNSYVSNDDCNEDCKNDSKENISGVNVESKENKNNCKIEQTLSEETIQNIKTYYTNCILLKYEQLSDENKKLYLKEIKARKLFKNIKPSNFKQFIKRVVLAVNIDLYFKLR